MQDGKKIDSCRRRNKRLRYLNKNMKLALNDSRKRKLAQLRLIHPEHHRDPAYKDCYERFFRQLGISCTRDILAEVAKMPPLLHMRPGKMGKREYAPIDAPEEDVMQQIDNVLNTLKPTEFDMAGFDENDPHIITEERLINDDDQTKHVVLFNK